MLLRTTKLGSKSDTFLCVPASRLPAPERTKWHGRDYYPQVSHKQQSRHRKVSATSSQLILLDWKEVLYQHHSSSDC